MKHRGASALAAVAAAVLVLVGCGSTPDPSPTTTWVTSTTTPETTTSTAPTLATAELPGAQADEAFSSQQSGAQVDVKAYIDLVVKDADRIWTDYFVRQLGAKEPQVRYYIIGAPGDVATFTSKCVTPQGTPMVVTPDTPNSYYCSDDNAGEGALLLPFNTFARMWTGEVLKQPSKRAGDFAAAVVVAHEFGHHIADELRIQFKWPKLTGANNELLADCFSGVWAYTAYYSGFLEAGDIEEGVAALEAIGDTGIGRDPHGTPEQRAYAFQKVGYDTGKPVECMKQYYTGATFNK